MMIDMGGEKPPAIAYQDRQLRANQSSVERGHTWVSWCSELIPTRMVLKISTKTSEASGRKRAAISYAPVLISEASFAEISANRAGLTNISVGWPFRGDRAVQTESRKWLTLRPQLENAPAAALLTGLTAANGLRLLRCRAVSGIRPALLRDPA
jgi:hypothetical protein